MTLHRSAAVFICFLLPGAFFAVPARAAAVLFKDPQFSVVQENDLVYGKGAVANGEMDLRLDLYQPAAAQAPRLKPGFIAVHGGGFIQGDKRFNPPIMAQLAKEMASRGYVAVSINYRLAPDKPVESGDEVSRSWVELETTLARFARAGKAIDRRLANFSIQDMATARAAAVADTGKALVWLKANAEKYGIDPNHIVMAGSSAGGMAVLMHVYGNDQSDGVRAVVDLWGKLDADDLRKIDAADPALLIVHGADDTIIPVKAADNLAAAAKKAGLSHRYIRVNGRGHGVPLSVRVHGQTIYEYIADFTYQHIGADALQ